MSHGTRARSVPVPITALLALCAAGPAGWLLAPASQDGPARAPRIGVVDLHKVLTADPRLRGDLERIQAAYQNFKDVELPALRDELDGLAVARDKLDPRTEEFARANAAFEGRAEAVKRVEANVAKYLNQQADLTNLDAYERICKTVADHAGRAGIDLVLRLRPPAEDSLRERLRSAELESVLYRNPALDITDDVIKLLAQ